MTGFLLTKEISQDAVQVHTDSVNKKWDLVCAEPNVRSEISNGVSCSRLHFRSVEYGKMVWEAGRAVRVLVK